MIETGIKELEIANSYLSSEMRSKLQPMRLLAVFCKFLVTSKYPISNEQERKITWRVTEEDTWPSHVGASAHICVHPHKDHEGQD